MDSKDSCLVCQVSTSRCKEVEESYYALLIENGEDAFVVKWRNILTSVLYACVSQ
jgi:hypothetical protein